MNLIDFEKIFAMENSSIKFGKGATLDVGYEAKRLEIKKVLILTDKNILNYQLYKMLSNL